MTGSQNVPGHTNPADNDWRAILIQNLVPGLRSISIYQRALEILATDPDSGRPRQNLGFLAQSFRAAGRTQHRHCARSTLGAVAFVFVLVILLGHYQKTRGHGVRAESFANHAQQTIDLQGAKLVSAAVHMGAGQLNLSGGSGHLLNAHFISIASGIIPLSITTCLTAKEIWM